MYDALHRVFFFFSSRRRQTRCYRDWSSDVCSSDLAQPPVEECRRKIFERYGLSDDMKLFVGVERMDYTKGIVDRFQAIEELFTNHPEWIGRLVFLQIAAPSRGTLPAYQHLHQECVDFVD